MTTCLKDLDEVNEEGVAYYDNLINELIENGITPLVTLYHWDLPWYLQESDLGWLSHDSPDWFEKYAKVCFERFGDRVSLNRFLGTKYVENSVYLR